MTQGDQYASFWNRLRDFLGKILSLGISDGVKLLARIIGILLAGAIIRAMDHKVGKGIQNAFRALYMIILSFIISSALETTMKLVEDTMNAVCSFLIASLPVSGMLLAMRGNLQRATLQGVSLQHGISVVATINTHFLAPILRFLLAITLAGSFTGNSLNSLTAFLAKFIKRTLLLLFSLLSAVLTIQNALAAAADSVSMRGVRFAAGSFIPVVGSLVGEGARTITAGLELVLKECGVACILILLYLLARPIVILFVQKLVLSASSAVGDIIGDKAGAAFLQGICAIWDLFIAVLVFQGCYFVYSVAIFLGGSSA